MRANLRSSLSVLVLAALLGACGSESTLLEPKAAEPRTLEDALGLIGVRSIPDALTPVYGVGMGVPVGVPAWGCVYGASTGSFVCAPETYEGFTIASSYTLLDAAGKPQSAYGATTTAAIRAVIDVDLGAKGAGSEFVIDNHHEVELTGLLTETRVLNGTSSEHVKGTFSYNGVPYPVDVTASTRMTDLVVRRPGTTGGTGWAPAAGTVTFESSAALGAGLPPATARVTMTFNGTSTVSIVATIGGVTRQCSYDPNAMRVPACT
jgi:hypothetical protein